MLQRLYEATIPGKLFRQLRLSEGLGDVLIFGCGFDVLPRVLAGYARDSHIPSPNILGYDIDRCKIEQHISYGEKEEYPNLGFTSDKPVRQFRTVLAVNVLHENPDTLAEEVRDFTLPEGYIGVMDYDMKGCSREEFFQRWGLVVDEKRERGKIGDEKAFALHTKFGLEDCTRIFEAIGVKLVFAQGKIKSRSGSLPPTEHFVYVGRRDAA